MVTSKSKDATPSGSKPARGWDATAHEALLLCVIDEIKGGKAFLTEVTRRMQERGYTYSYDAIKYLQATFFFSLFQQRFTVFFYLYKFVCIANVLCLSFTLANMFKSCARVATPTAFSPLPIRLLLEPPRLRPPLARRPLLLVSAALRLKRTSARTRMMTTSSSSWSRLPRTKRCTAHPFVPLSAPESVLRKYFFSSENHMVFNQSELYVSNPSLSLSFCRSFDNGFESLPNPDEI